MDRRSLLAGGGTLLVANVLSQETEARARMVPVEPQDGEFMALAIEQAKHADFPFGAVIVRNTQVLALGQNCTRRNSDPTAHGEMMAIRAFLQGHEPDVFKETTLYTSGEPCAMCMGAIIWCGISRLVYAASIQQLTTKIGQIDITSQKIARATPFSDIRITGGLLAEEALALFK